MRPTLPFVLWLAACGPVGGGGGDGTDTGGPGEETAAEPTADCSFESIAPLTVSRSGGDVVDVTLSCDDPSLVSAVTLTLGDEVVDLIGADNLDGTWSGSFTTWARPQAGVVPFTVEHDGDLSAGGDELRFFVDAADIGARLTAESTASIGDWPYSIDAAVAVPSGRNPDQIDQDLDLVVVSVLPDATVMGIGTGHDTAGTQSFTWTGTSYRRPHRFRESNLTILSGLVSNNSAPTTTSWASADGVRRPAFVVPGAGLDALDFAYLTNTPSGPVTAGFTLDYDILGQAIAADETELSRIAPAVLSVLPTIDTTGTVSALEVIVATISPTDGSTQIVMMKGTNNPDTGTVWVRNWQWGLTRQVYGATPPIPLDDTRRGIILFNGSDTGGVQAVVIADDGAVVGTREIEGLPGDIQSMVSGPWDFDDDGVAEFGGEADLRAFHIVATTTGGRVFDIVRTVTESLGFGVAGAPDAATQLQASFQFDLDPGDTLDTPTLRTHPNGDVEIGIDVHRAGYTTSWLATWQGVDGAPSSSDLPDSVRQTSAGGEGVLLTHQFGTTAPGYARLIMRRAMKTALAATRSSGADATSGGTTDPGTTVDAGGLLPGSGTADAAAPSTGDGTTATSSGAGATTGETTATAPAAGDPTGETATTSPPADAPTDGTTGSTDPGTPLESPAAGTALPGADAGLSTGDTGSTQRYVEGTIWSYGVQSPTSEVLLAARTMPSSDLDTWTGGDVRLAAAHGWSVISRDGMVVAIDPSGAELDDTLPLDPTLPARASVLDGRLIVFGQVLITADDGTTSTGPGVLTAGSDGVGVGVMKRNRDPEDEDLTDKIVWSSDLQGRTTTVVGTVTSTAADGSYSIGLTSFDTSSLPAANTTTEILWSVSLAGVTGTGPVPPEPLFVPSQRTRAGEVDGSPIADRDTVQTLGTLSAVNSVDDIVLVLPWDTGTACPHATVLIPGTSSDLASNLASAVVIDTSDLSDCSDLSVPVTLIDVDGDGNPGAVLGTWQPGTDEVLVGLWELLWDGSRVLRLPEILVQALPNTTPRNLGVHIQGADFDGDGKQDLGYTLASPTTTSSTASGELPLSSWTHVVFTHATRRTRPRWTMSRALTAETRRLVDCCEAIVAPPTGTLSSTEVLDEAGQPLVLLSGAGGQRIVTDRPKITYGSSVWK